MHICAFAPHFGVLIFIDLNSKAAELKSDFIIIFLLSSEQSILYQCCANSSLSSSFQLAKFVFLFFLLCLMFRSINTRRNRTLRSINRGKKKAQGVSMGLLSILKGLVLCKQLIGSLQNRTDPRLHSDTIVIGSSKLLDTEERIVICNNLLLIDVLN